MDWSPRDVFASGIVLLGLAISANALRTIGAATQAPARLVVGPLIGSALAKSLLSGVKFHHGKKIRSAALLADAWNDSVDILSALAALVAASFTIVAPPPGCAPRATRPCN